MSTRNPHPRSITDRLDALRFELKAEIMGTRSDLRLEIAALRTELKSDIAGLRTEVKSDIAALAGDFREFKGTVRGSAIVIATLVPLVTAIAVVAANQLAKHLLG